eukprot:358595-Chlamydomonas_euryale.AAC.6
MTTQQRGRFCQCKLNEAHGGAIPSPKNAACQPAYKLPACRGACLQWCLPACTAHLPADCHVFRLHCCWHGALPAL